MSATDDYRKRIYVGVSKVANPTSGETPTFHAAAKDAHDQMTAAGVTTGRLRLVESIHNPITEYHAVFVLEP